MDIFSLVENFILLCKSLTYEICKKMNILKKHSFFYFRQNIKQKSLKKGLCMGFY